jgi:hypothetical protein
MAVSRIGLVSEGDCVVVSLVNEKQVDMEQEQADPGLSKGCGQCTDTNKRMSNQER